MTEQEILERLEPIFQDVFDEDELNLTPEMTPGEMENWDSLSNIRLFVAVEKAFRIKFETKEVTSAKSVGEFVAMIESKKPDGTAH